MRAALLAVPLALVACGDGAAPVARSTASAPAASATPHQIGTVSGLSAQTSALSGAVSDFAVERTALGTRVLLAADTLFEFDKATLTAAAQANVARTAELVRQGGAGRVTVTGYTDAKGEVAYNLALSQRRATAVVAALQAQPGLAERDLAAVGKGEADPVAPNAAPDGGDDPGGRARNRRVIVDIPR